MTDHVLRAILRGNAGYLLVSLYGDANSPQQSDHQRLISLLSSGGLPRAGAKLSTVIYYDASICKSVGIEAPLGRQKSNSDFRI